MSGRRWRFDHWGTTYELRLDGATGEGQPCPPSRIRRLLPEWLAQDSAARKLRDIDAHLGGIHPYRPDRAALAHYREGLQRRVHEAIEFGSLRAFSREAPRHAGPGKERPVERERPLAAEDPAGLTLVVRTASGHAVEDDAGFILVGPGGREEHVKLSNGRFERPSAPRGAYQVRFRYLRNAAWSADAIACGEEAGLSVETPGFDDGARVQFEVHERFTHRSEPVARFEAKVSVGKASATWKHAQAQGEPAGGEYVFEAGLGAKLAQSEVLTVTPHAMSTFAGVKERLVQLGYECGTPGPERTPELDAALKTFQERCGFAEPSGKCDDATTALLEALT